MEALIYKFGEMRFCTVAQNTCLKLLRLTLVLARLFIALSLILEDQH